MTERTVQDPSEEKPSRRLNHGLHLDLGIPKGMVMPGQDGYLTPMIGDYPRQAHKRRPDRRPGLSRHNSSIRTPIAEYFSAHTPNLSNISLGRGLLDKLEWRERIRHYTWTFFTMTMATGGVANVLHSGGYIQLT